MIVTNSIRLETAGDTDIIDITQELQSLLSRSKLKSGMVSVSVAGSTAAITTCEYEPALVKDIKKLFQDIIPKNKSYHHDATWGDANGYAHLRSSLVGTSKTFPFINAKLSLGTWQQIILIDFDNRPRKREVIVQFIGE
ncbi:MAG: secondary thiamine-phosphate synthase enzyme YjbQ [Candidatus Omnitrophota bacterium]